jgi:thioredoxin reductase
MPQNTSNFETGVHVAPVSASADPEDLDVAIIGGGPAGLSAALILGRARRRVAVVDAGSPRNARASHMHGFLSRDGLPPAELLSIGRSEVRSYGVEIIDDQVVDANTDLTLTLSNGRKLGVRHVLIATGAWDALPAIPGLAQRWGRDVLHCPYCHGWEVRDARLGVIGTNTFSVGHALLIRQWSSDVTFFTHELNLAADDEYKLQARGITIIRGRVEGMHVEEDRLSGVCLGNGRRVPLDTIFIRTLNVMHPDGLVAQFGCAMDSQGFVAVDKDGRTSVPRVWAAGNVVDPRLSVIASAGTAAMSAMAINAELVAEDVELALEESPPLDRSPTPPTLA